jgi:hypothetical protein
LTRLSWPQFDPTTESWAEIAVDNQAQLTFALPSKYDAACPNVTIGALLVLGRMISNRFQCVGRVLSIYDITEFIADDNKELQMR